MCPVYLGPLTSPAAAEVVASKKARGAVVYAETSAAAVILDGEEYWNQCWRHNFRSEVARSCMGDSESRFCCNAMLKALRDLIRSLRALQGPLRAL